MSAEMWWQIEGWPSPAEWQAFAAVATLVVAILAGLAALGQLDAMRRANETANEANQRAAEAQIEAMRPYVVVRFELQAAIPKRPSATADGGFVLVVVENLGRTPARDLTLRSIPEFQTSGDGAPGDGVDPVLINLLEKFSGDYVINQLAPTEKFAYILDTSTGLVASGDELPWKYEIALRYGAREGDGRPFRETQQIDLAPWMSSSIYEEPIEVIAQQARRQNEKGEAFQSETLRLLSQIATTL